MACEARELREKAKQNLRTKPRSDAACGEEFRFTFPDDTQTRLQPQPAEGWCFSDAEDGVSSDESTPGLFTPPTSVGGAQLIPAHDGGAPLGVPNPCALWARGAREKRTILFHSAVPECHTWTIPRQCDDAGHDGGIGSQN